MEGIDVTLQGLVHLLRTVRTNHGWRSTVIELRRHAQSKDPGQFCRAARMLYNDYEHLREHGLKPRQAINTILAPTAGEKNE